MLARHRHGDIGGSLARSMAVEMTSHRSLSICALGHAFHKSTKGHVHSHPYFKESKKIKTISPLTLNCLIALKLTCCLVIASRLRSVQASKRCSSHPGVRWKGSTKIACSLNILYVKLTSFTSVTCSGQSALSDSMLGSAFAMSSPRHLPCWESGSSPAAGSCFRQVTKPARP